MFTGRHENRWMEAQNAEYASLNNSPGIFKLTHNDFLRETEQARCYLVSFVVGGYAVGSATLVSMDERLGLLTARHVWENEIVPAFDRFTLALGNRGEFGGFLRGLECRVANCRPFCVGTREAAKPDIAFIELTSEADRQRIGAVNPFYRIEKSKLEMIGRHAVSHMPVMVWGTLASNIEHSGAVQPAPIHHFCGEGERLTLWTKDTPWDYCEIKLRSGQGNYPNDYARMSGGGAWTVGVEELEPGKYAPPKLFLVGVTIEQAKQRGGSRQIVLHGPCSIYEGIVDHVNSTK